MKFFKSTLLIIISACFFTPSSEAQIYYHESIADSLFRLLKNEKLIIGGAAAVSIDDHIIWEKAIGTMDELKKEAFQSNTKTRTASIAKPITAVAVLQLVEKGLVDLDTPIHTYVPSYPKNERGNITVRHLLNHSSGIDGYKGRESQTRTNYPTLQDVLQVFEDRDLKFTPGSQYSYTSYGYVLLGVIIENVSGMNYKEYLETFIFKPAGMINSGIEIYGQKYSGKSILYHRKRKGKIVNVKKANNLSNRVPAGGIYSTVKDMIAFGQALLDGSLLSKEYREIMWTDAKIRSEEDGNPYTLGWHIYSTKPPIGKVFGHSGGQLGCSSQLMIMPDINAVVVILTNTSASLNEVRNQSIRLINCMNFNKNEILKSSIGEN